MFHSPSMSVNHAIVRVGGELRHRLARKMRRADAPAVPLREAVNRPLRVPMHRVWDDAAMANLR